MRSPGAQGLPDGVFYVSTFVCHVLCFVSFQVSFQVSLQVSFQNTHYPLEAAGVENNLISTPSSSESTDVVVVFGVEVSRFLSGEVLKITKAVPLF